LPCRAAFRGGKGDESTDFGGLPRACPEGSEVFERKVKNWRIITASPATQRLMRIKTHQNTSMQDQPVDYPDVRLETKKFTTLNPANWQRTVYRNQGKTHSSQ
jgi:hypothetical protein